MNSENRIAELERELAAALKERGDAREEIRRLNAECDRPCEHCFFYAAVREGKE